MAVLVTYCWLNNCSKTQWINEQIIILVSVGHESQHD